MFGETIDYYLLKPLTHKKNYATREDISKKARETTFTLSDGKDYLNKLQSYFDNKIPISPDLSYLDIGCGMGRLLFGLSEAGAKDITGVDIIPWHIDEAKTIANGIVEDDCVKPKFFHEDIHEWETEKKFDVLFVIGAMEHIHSPDNFLKSLSRYLSPKGMAFVSHEPFQSPIGDHMHAFFRIQIPWRGVLFSEKAILQLREECFRPSDPVSKYEEIAGGLNQMSFSKYKRFVREAGLKFVYHSFNPQIWLRKKYRVLWPISAVTTNIPLVQDYFITNAYSIITKA